MEGDFKNLNAGRRAILIVVVAYLVRHPGAKDTAEGIRKWWHDPNQPEGQPAELDDVIERLVTRNWLLKREAAQETFFGANPASLEEMAHFLIKTANETKE